MRKAASDKEAKEHAESLRKESARKDEEWKNTWKKQFEETKKLCDRLTNACQRAEDVRKALDSLKRLNDK